MNERHDFCSLNSLYDLTFLTQTWKITVVLMLNLDDLIKGVGGGGGLAHNKNE